MCGRGVQYPGSSTYARALGAAGRPNVPPHYNGAPGQDLLVVRSHPDTGQPEVGVLRWGLIPSWAKDRKIAWRLITARCETRLRMPAFRKAYASRRCLIPVDGLYEWRKIGKAKQPYMIAMKDREPFTLAGLWENWKTPTARNGADVHDRGDGREQAGSGTARPHARHHRAGRSGSLVKRRGRAQAAPS